MEGEAKVVVHGKEYPLIGRDDWTLGECAEGARITGQDYDWDKPLNELGWLAILYMTVRRVDPTVTLPDIEHLRQDEIDLKAPEADDAVPPERSAASNGSGAASTGSGANDSAPRPEPTPEPTGAPS